MPGASLTVKTKRAFSEQTPCRGLPISEQRQNFPAGLAENTKYGLGRCPETISAGAQIQNLTFDVI